MLLNKGNLVNEIVTTNQPNYDLNGMICPTFQNLGDSDVMFNGLILSKGDSYSVNVPTIVLANKIDIRFLTGTNNKLVVSYVRPEQN